MGTLSLLQWQKVPASGHRHISPELSAGDTARLHLHLSHPHEPHCVEDIIVAATSKDNTLRLWKEVQKQCKRAWRASTFRVASFLIESKILPIDSSQFMLGSLILLPTISLYVLDFWFFIL
ncbi:uncharacterized protein LOC115967450 [Quercus lobata]|uniref:uncharacterized protein LOC115967450 n=1 Tax=Quercus lobata TaxID=97700 RepID=UPI001243E2C8|nr:uncharacterized protein LOC115967450 [Quercus lobata]